MTTYFLFDLFLMFWIILFFFILDCHCKASSLGLCEAHPHRALISQIIGFSILTRFANKSSDKCRKSILCKRFLDIFCIYLKEN